MTRPQFDQGFEGVVVMITGAARGMGRQHAVAFAEAGADLILGDLCADLPGAPYPLSTRRQLEETAQDCRRLGAHVATVTMDVRSESDVDDAVAAGVAELGPVDVLVNNAGLLGPGGRPAHELTETEWTMVIDVNLSGVFRCARAVLPGMVAARSGSIVNIASTGGLVAFERFASYVASKHGVVGLTKALALEYGRYGIRVNAVCPSTVRADPLLQTESTAGVAASLGSTLADYESASLALHALPALVSARDVAAASLWLASSAAAGVTGSVLTVDAGYTAR
jgi:NAD(P)-dependent dehydrogenase (short-subunit alcohol dehydrogenase family)